MSDTTKAKRNTTESNYMKKKTVVWDTLMLARKLDSSNFKVFVGRRSENFCFKGASPVRGVSSYLVFTFIFILLFILLFIFKFIFKVGWDSYTNISIFSK